MSRIGPHDLARDLVTAALAARGLELSGWQPLAGDVSPRHYFRVVIDGTVGAILALYSSEIRPICARFQATAELLAGAGVRGPKIFAADCDGGWMLLEDAGPRTLAEREDLTWALRLPYYEEALRLIERIAVLPAEHVAELNPPLGAELLERELLQTWDLFFVPRGLVADDGFAAELRQLFASLCAAVGAGPLVPCHRDFMARNLVPLETSEAGALVVLDHQDLRLGPAAYDVASLLNDTLFPPPELEGHLLALAGWEAGDRRLAYHRAAAQRTLKAIGTYVSFANRGADRHLPLVGPTFERALAHLSRLPEAADVAARLAGVDLLD
jgi:N-acetylmuramate 1-kinase